MCNTADLIGLHDPHPKPTVADLPVRQYVLDAWGDGTIDVLLVNRGKVRGQGADHWAIVERGSCLAKDGTWEYEPLPSSRDDAFMERCRWNSAQDAYTFWLESGARSVYEHYRTRWQQGGVTS